MNTKNLLNDLETAIIEGSLRSGTKLPPERTLAAQYKISRSSVREAMQQLKAKSLVKSRHGGGHYVSNQLQESHSQTLLDLLARNPEAHFDLLEFRRCIEGECAYYAALRANALDLEVLQNAYQELEKAYACNKLGAKPETDANFHLAIAEASHNVIFLHQIKSLFTALQNNMHINIGRMLENSNSSNEALMAQHTAIYKAIINRDSCAAQEAMHHHINYVEKILQDIQREHFRKERSERRKYLQQEIHPKG